jgi:hypothetical protein
MKTRSIPTKKPYNNPNRGVGVCQLILRWLASTVFDSTIKESFVFSLGTLVITALVCLLLGGVAGAAVLNLVRTQRHSREMEQRIQAAENTLKSYQQDVAEHFAQTSELVNDLTQSYRNVHEHLAKSALKLATPAISRQILESAKGHLLAGDATYAGEQSVEPPRDWAPKTIGEKGALSEDFGLHENPLPEDGVVETELPEDNDERELHKS